MTLVVKPLRAILFLVAVSSLLPACDSVPDPVRLQGMVFGTGWTLTYLPDDETPPASEIRDGIEAAFELVNTSMNTYDPESTISQLNALPPGEEIVVEWDFTYVFNEAIKVTELSGGAYDVSLSPLLEVWGFGPDGPEAFPEEPAVNEALSRVGLEYFDWDPSTRTLSKNRAGVALEFSSIAKGYGVDLAADVLDDFGVDDFMLEVGGEIQLRGNSPRGGPWRIAIERPESAARSIQAAVSLTDVGLATSGDYRNYFERDGKRYSHLVDPRTGYPIEHDLVSVTVIHPATALADAWATAFSIMGAAETLALAEERDMAVYVIRREGEELVVSWSASFEPYLVSAQAER